MNFEEYEERAMSLAIYPDQGNNLIYPTLGLAGEAGEVADKVKKVIRDHGGDPTDSFPAIFKELGDVLWYVTACARELGVTLEDVAIGNLRKLESRAKRGTLGGNGDER
jgi:NTP pyrophosphatase (non-canonical NTP hydrolase)